MKKLILLSLVLVLTVALSISVFQANSGTTGTMAKTTSGTIASHSVQGASQFAFDFFRFPQPYIGWNS